jgi:uncharacterized protein YjbJ (UPF0337 family)
MKWARGARKKVKGRSKQNGDDAKEKVKIEMSSEQRRAEVSARLLHLP